MNYDKYEALENLNNLRKNGVITEEEYEREKDKILNEDVRKEGFTSKPLFGLEENNYLMIMHLSQFVSSIILPFILWLIAKDSSPRVDSHGKDIINFTISYFIWSILSVIAVIFLIGFVALGVIGVLVTVFIVIAAVKAANGEDWRYPLTIPFLK